MADRNMANKRRRMKMRHKLRRWSEKGVVNTGHYGNDRNIQKFEAIHAVADKVMEFIPNDPTQVIAYRKRAKSLTKTQKGPVTFNDPRMRALVRRAELINEIQPFLSITVRDNRWEKVELCYNMSKTVWVIYKEDHIYHKASMSVSYNKKELALAALRSNNFPIKEEVSLLE